MQMELHFKVTRGNSPPESLRYPHWYACFMETPKSNTPRETALQAGRYLIGAFVALAIDACIVSLTVTWGVPLLIARLLAMLAGVTTTYAFNRRFTFKPTQPASVLDWGRYVAAQSLGNALNFGVSSVLLFYSDRSVLQIWGAVLVGAAVGFCVNFFSARRLLHR